MGLFGNIFEKKECAICGKEIGLLGNRKLADGNMCKDCAAKLSPYFSDRKQSTIADIQRQLAYRADNETKLASFNPTKTVGLSTKAYIDEAQKAFVISRYSDFRKGNPDIIPLDTVTAVDLEIKENRTEVMDTDSEGKKVSYDPKRYSYSYDFYNTIYVRNEWFDDIRFEVTDNRTEATSIVGKEYKFLEKAGKEMQNALMPEKYPLEEEKEETAAQTAVSQGYVQTGKWRCQCGTINEASSRFCSACGKARPVEAKTWKCPNCGHTNAEDAKFCSSCGKARVIRWFCPQCGKENEGLFCPACGTKKPENLDAVTRETPSAVRNGGDAAQ